MSQPKGIHWLASYPKSGNTWFRIILSRLLSQATTLNYINDMDTILGSTMFVSRAWINKALGFDSTLLNLVEMEEMRLKALKWNVQQLDGIIYNKIHDAYTLVKDREPLIPTEGSLSALYFVRNPLDVAISLAHHANCPIDWSIYMMGNASFVMPLHGNQGKQLQQKLLTWSQHVESWTQQVALPTLVLRYEDMLAHPLETFHQGVAFINLETTESALKAAISDATFDKLQQYETSHGFKEKPAIKGNFFRKGIAGDWQHTLTKKQIQKIIHDHEAIMYRYGYIDNQGQVIA